jgi:hypothetical protein
MELHPLVSHEWRDDHCLSRRSLIWIHDHADPGDPHPVLTAVAELRAQTSQPPLTAPEMLQVGREVQSALAAQEVMEQVVAEMAAPSLER